MSKTNHAASQAGRLPARTWPALGAVAAVAALVATASCTTRPAPGEEQAVAATEHVCSSCHADGGRSISPTFPRLAGQQPEYLVVQLKAFRDKSRADPHAHTYMWGMAAKLSDPTIDGLAAFYAAQKPAPGTPGDPAEITAGAKIFTDGIPETDVPACMACHGEHGEGAGAIPRLAGQHRSYLERQLEAFASASRANDIMHENAMRLTPEQIRQFAAYAASL